MATLTAPSPAKAPAPLGKTKGAGADTAFKLLALGSGLLVLAILALIAVTMTSHALPAFRKMGLSFITSDDWRPNDDSFGALAFIYGTLLTSLLALLLAVPMSIGIALTSSLYAPRWLRNPLVYVIDLLSAIPSVVYGLWGILVLAPFIGPVYDWIADKVAGIPVLSSIFGQSLSGKAFATAGLILAFMITPIITSITREVFETVPKVQKDAALALGATRWEMIRATVFPHSRAGMVGAVMLGLGRAMGETIAAALVIGSSPQIVANIFAPGDTMAASIANGWGEADDLYRSALIGLGVTLFAMTIVVNLIAQWIVNRGKQAAGAGV